jgi:Mor family transcriptional regulator
MDAPPPKSTPRQIGAALLQDLADKIAAQLQSRFGVDGPAARAAATAVAVGVADDWGGQLVYIPQDMAGRLAQRNKTIWREFHGDNHAELASKYGLCVQTVYSIIAEQRELHTPKQLSLPVDRA